MHEYSRKVIGRQAADLGFIRDTFEKVSRLVGVLTFFEKDPVLSKYLALKGGTAINLTIRDMPRLSVDIDLDFAENLPLDDTLAARKIISDTIDRFMAMQGYSINRSKSKQYHALDSYVFQYTNSGGVNDNIKIEINYSLRSHILPLLLRPIETLGVFEPIKVLSLDPIEIFASKIVALLTRSAERDLYDVNGMIERRLFTDAQADTLRKSVVFYAAIGSGVAPSNFEFDKLDVITERDIKARLIPMLRKKEWFELAAGRERVKQYLSELLALHDSEKLFLASFRNGKYKPELLFDGDRLERIRNHPMAAWKMRQQGSGGLEQAP